MLNITPSPANLPPSLVVIDDEKAIGDLICDIADTLGYDTNAYTATSEFKSSLTGREDIIFVDLLMPDEDGVEILRYLASEHIDSQVVLISGYDKRVLKSASVLGKALGLNIAGELKKPFTLKEMKSVLNNCLIEQTASPSIHNDFTLQDLELAIQQERVFVQYQPKINLTTGSTYGAEALVRINTPDGKTIPPGQFIELAEKSGHIKDITRIVLTDSIHFCKHLQSIGWDINIAVNVPSVLLTDVRFADEFIEQIELAGIKPSSFTVEITESALAENYAVSLDIVTRLRMRGIQLSIDDFGTGYSTLQQLKNFPFNEMKLDRSFVSDIHDDENKAIILKSIELAHDLGLDVLAEGVESKEIEQELLRNGCDHAQGYFYSRPVSEDIFIQHLQHSPATEHNKVM
ncbi:MAG: EAL domain-containing response regulator [Gammaproteobacteria bacterium]|nr:EAL domain-containing response regulator [Gammaproteobacteria bacterium]